MSLAADRAIERRCLFLSCVSRTKQTVGSLDGQYGSCRFQHCRFTLSRHGLEFPNQFLIQLGAHVQQHLVGSRARHRCSVGPPLDHGGEHIGNGHHAHKVGYFIGLEAMRISRAVEVLVMVDNDFQHLGGKFRCVLESIKTELRMLP